MLYILLSILNDIQFYVAAQSVTAGLPQHSVAQPTPQQSSATVTHQQAVHNFMPTDGKYCNFIIIVQSHCY